MAFVYVLYSKIGDRYYIGSCQDLDKRILQHLNMEFDLSFTRSFYDWELYFKIEDLEYKQARKIENHIKRMKSRTFIKNLKKYSEISSRLREKYK